MKHAYNTSNILSSLFVSSLSCPSARVSCFYNRAAELAEVQEAELKYGEKNASELWIKIFTLGTVRMNNQADTELQNTSEKLNRNR